jgi:hypothetical protein
MGQDLRKLLYDGVPPANLYAADINLTFISLGHSLFRDKDALPSSHFLVADLFDDSPDPATGLNAWDGKFDIVLASSVFHLFSLEQQVQVARRVVRLLKDEVGVMAVGHQIGRAEMERVGDAGEESETKMYRHDAGSWRKMWEDVGREARTRWDVRVKMGELPMSGMEDGVAFFRFEREGREVDGFHG